MLVIAVEVEIVLMHMMTASKGLVKAKEAVKDAANVKAAREAAKVVKAGKTVAAAKEAAKAAKAAKVAKMEKDAERAGTALVVRDHNLARLAAKTVNH